MGKKTIVFDGVKPMSNIEILEERINFCKNNAECREELKQCFGCSFEIEEIQALENLIQENKELKERNKYLPAWVSRKYISKDKVKEKIEELENEYEYLGNDCKRANTMARQILQELLKGE